MSASASQPQSRLILPNTGSSWHSFSILSIIGYPILSEADEDRKKFLLATAAVARRELIRVLAAMGITVPPVM